MIHQYSPGWTNSCISSTEDYEHAAKLWTGSGLQDFHLRSSGLFCMINRRLINCGSYIYLALFFCLNLFRSSHYCRQRLRYLSTLNTSRSRLDLLDFQRCEQIYQPLRVKKSSSYSRGGYEPSWKRARFLDEIMKIGLKYYVHSSCSRSVFLLQQEFI